MAQLIVRNVDDRVAAKLKARARQRGTSAEAEHRRILEAALLGPDGESLSLMDFLTSDAQAVYPDTELPLERSRSSELRALDL